MPNCCNTSVIEEQYLIWQCHAVINLWHEKKTGDFVSDIDRQIMEQKVIEIDKQNKEHRGNRFIKDDTKKMKTADPAAQSDVDTSVD